MPPEAFQLNRRDLLIVGAAAIAAAGPARAGQIDTAFAAMEAAVGGRLGLYAQEWGGDQIVAYRAGERFLMCSTFKALAVAAILARVDKGQERLDRWIAYGHEDLQEYAPTAKANLPKGGMTLGDLCAAAIELSDNTAANLIIAELGGPGGVTRFVRSLGDQTTRLDRNEPTLNRPGALGDPHDTTTPASMVGLWRRLLLQDALSHTSRERLADWLEACQTGANRLKAVTPPGWTIGHKTGWGATIIADVAILTPPDRRPILIAAYLEAPDALDHPHDQVLAEAGRRALQFLTQNA